MAVFMEVLTHQYSTDVLLDGSGQPPKSHMNSAKENKQHSSQHLSPHNYRWKINTFNIAEFPLQCSFTALKSVKQI